MARAHGSNAQLLGKFESTYGSTPSGNYIKLPFVSTTLGAEQGLLADDTLGHGRDPNAPGRDIVKCDGDVVVPLDARNVGHWLKGLLGAPVTTGTDPDYVHTFHSGAASLPSLSLEIGMPEVPSFAMVAGVAVDKVSLKMATSGNASATFSLIGQGETRTTSTAGGTPTTATYTRFSQFQGSVKKAGTALGNVVSADIAYANNLDAVRVIRDDGKIEGCDPGKAAFTGSIVVRFADTALLTAASNGTPIDLEFSYAIDANTSLVIQAPNTYLPKPKTPISGPGGIECTFAWQAARQADGGPMLTVVLSNNVSTY